MRQVFRVAGLTVGLALAVSGTASASPTFNLTFISGTGASAQTAFQSAASYWASRFTDNVSIDLTVGTGSLGSGILAQAGSVRTSYTYSSYRGAATAGGNQTSATDSAVAAILPSSASPLDIYINYTSDNPNGTGSPTPYVDSAGANNTTIRMTNANAKALGLTPTLGTVTGCTGNCDAFIQFSTGFTYDYDRSNGISFGTYDFLGLAIHEIGHALGFVSGVDVLDGFSSTSFFTANAFTYVAPLDMFRCSTASSTAGADLDFTADNRTKSFSLDNCATTLGTFSNGINHGDGQQASHWKDGLGLGVMDPTAATGELLTVTTLDLTAFDAIGWELASTVTAAPEPGVLLLGGTWVLGLAAARRNRRRD